MIDRETFEHNGATFMRWTEDDDTGSRNPWDDDGHGDVSEWVMRTKKPGEVRIDPGTNRKVGWAVFYDFAGAVKKAKAEDWGHSGKSKAELLELGFTAGQIAADAAKADMQRMKDWFLDRWHYVGVVVALCDDDGEPLPMPYRASLWGIESDAGDYLDEVSEECADEIIAGLAASAGRVA
jgi:hypothetical protein